uniref:CRAL-TRIO domain-containing protein n=2 Tax=Leersia perrieri TaxID=77586 RepID=A0A0D9W1F5_9ORYZ
MLLFIRVKDDGEELVAMDYCKEEHLAGDDGDVTEWKKVAELRRVVEAQDPACKEEDDYSLRRFLRARDHNISKSSSMLLKYLQWKREFKPGNRAIAADEVRNELAQEKLYLQGHDRHGRPLIYLFGARHFPSRRDLDEFKRFVVFILDQTCARLSNSNSNSGGIRQEKFAAVADLAGWGYYANCDIRAYVAALEIMQNYYPERLGRVFLIHVPYVFMAAWKIVYPFIDDNTKKKFVFVADKDLEATLREAIDESNLAEEYGGKLKLVSLATMVS